MALLWSLISTFIVSALSLIGVFTLLIKKATLQKIRFYLIGFSAGALIGGAFLHILTEVLEQTRSISVFYYVRAGFVLFSCWSGIFPGGTAMKERVKYTLLPL